MFDLMYTIPQLYDLVHGNFHCSVNKCSDYPYIQRSETMPFLCKRWHQGCPQLSPQGSSETISRAVCRFIICQLHLKDYRHSMSIFKFLFRTLWIIVIAMLEAVLVIWPISIHYQNPVLYAKHCVSKRVLLPYWGAWRTMNNWE